MGFRTKILLLDCRREDCGFYCQYPFFKHPFSGCRFFKHTFSGCQLPFPSYPTFWSAQAVLAPSHDKSGAWIQHSKVSIGVCKHLVCLSWSWYDTHTWKRVRTWKTAQTRSAVATWALTPRGLRGLPLRGAQRQASDLKHSFCGCRMPDASAHSALLEYACILPSIRSMPIRSMPIRSMPSSRIL